MVPADLDRDLVQASEWAQGSASGWGRVAERARRVARHRLSAAVDLWPPCKSRRECQNTCGQRWLRCMHCHRPGVRCRIRVRRTSRQCGFPDKCRPHRKRLASNTLLGIARALCSSRRGDSRTRSRSASTCTRSCPCSCRHRQDFRAPRTCSRGTSLWSRTRSRLRSPRHIAALSGPPLRCSAPTRQGRTRSQWFQVRRLSRPVPPLHPCSDDRRMRSARASLGIDQEHRTSPWSGSRCR